MKKSVQAETHNTWNERIRKLTFQGDFVQLLIEEQENVSWKSICNNIPKGVLSFALKSCTNGLNTPDNLKRWGIRKMDKCCLCKNRGTLEHTLNYCSVALNQGRFTWRHNSVLAHFTTELKKHKSNHIEIYADLPSHNINGGTIPQDITQTALRPDLVLIERKAKKIHLLELTCSFETNIDAAYHRKYKNYTDLKSDLENSGWAVQLYPFEIGSRGHATKIH